MALLEFQTALGEAIRSPATRGPDSNGDATEPRAPVARILSTEGFKFTRKVQKSWSRGRAAKSARLTLSILPPDLRERILDEWIAEGGGVASFHASEADAFLNFIAARLPFPSHALTFCRLEQATIRANEGRASFACSDYKIPSPKLLLKRGAFASVVPFFGDPNQILSAIDTGKWPPISPELFSMLFAPGLPNLCRPMTPPEFHLWQRLSTPAAATDDFCALYSMALIQNLITIGALEFSETRRERVSVSKPNQP